MARRFGTHVELRQGIMEPRVVGLVLGRVDCQKSTFRREGYFEQRFYKNAQSCLFENQEYEETCATLV